MFILRRVNNQPNWEATQSPQFLPSHSSTQHRIGFAAEQQAAKYAFGPNIVLQLATVVQEYKVALHRLTSQKEEPCAGRCTLHIYTSKVAGLGSEYFWRLHVPPFMFMEHSYLNVVAELRAYNPSLQLTFCLTSVLYPRLSIFHECLLYQPALYTSFQSPGYPVKSKKRRTVYIAKLKLSMHIPVSTLVQFSTTNPCTIFLLFKAIFRTKGGEMVSSRFGIGRRQKPHNVLIDCPLEDIRSGRIRCQSFTWLG